MNTLFFLQIRQEKICTKIDLVTRSCFVLCLLKTIIVSALKKKLYFLFYQKYICQDNIRPDIRYPALTGYPVSGFWISPISSRPDIRQKQYPVHPLLKESCGIKGLSI
jgi:hypothetical protein